MKHCLLAILLIALALGSTHLWLQDYLATPLNIAADEYTLVVERGTSLQGVAKLLASQGILQAPAVFSGYGRVSGLAGRIQAGEYALETGTTPDTLFDMLVTGRVKLYSMTIIEGWTVAELLQALARHPAIAHSVEPDSVEDLTHLLGLDYPHPEGLFFPDTYHFPRGTSDLELLRQAHELLITQLNQAWSGREPHAVLESPYQGLILASIVERETALSEERAQIAGVFLRRLEQGMLLQTDPTVIYGLGQSFDGNLVRRHLKTDTPYNTYVRKGLPPTPIALPGKSALQAMAHPAPGGALYFVATGNGDGSHHFTATLEEHNAAVARYLAILKRQKGQGR